MKFLNKDLLWQFSDFWFVKKKTWIAPSLWFQKLAIGGQSLVLIFTLGQTGGIMGMTLVEPCHKNNSNWQGMGVVTSTHNRPAWQPPFSHFFKFPFFTVAGEQWKDFNKNNTSQVCNYIFTCWQNSPEKVTSCQVLCFQPCSPSHLPPLTTHLSSFANGASLVSLWDLSELVKVRYLSQR